MFYVAGPVYIECLTYIAIFYFMTQLLQTLFMHF